eukprot:CAMPEP_0202900468 /NCGR_PEP_ID=MMETSP1392-20130828/11803_1 /ASSEMBLY_ACC=CAM_ASM_000868 /TAXON_ID=225041 /ORGANISM="Chlamydomonas chlamydogama, Strain SAG 11-48b" /LENGTH=167 /DNA_ID=CAMNT_0049586861 /DNA_START=23 /DNA_END=526 /DNA_ORIENTATION=+
MALSSISSRRTCLPQARPFVAAAKVIKPRSQRSCPQAYVEQSVTYAVTQQAIAFAMVLGAEAFYTRTQLPENNKGRPEIVPVAAGAGSTLVSTLLVNVGSGPLLSLGLISGLMSAGAMMAYNVKRTIDTTDDDLVPDWPGPKAWPATMALISFFALNVFLQGLRAEL